MSRQRILDAIGQNKPSFEPLPVPTSANKTHRNGRADLITLFKEMTEMAGGRVIELAGLNEIPFAIEKYFSDSIAVYCCVPGLAISTVDADGLQTPDQLAKLDLVISQGGVAVAENGAVWVCDEDVDVRAVWFITRHLALIVKKKNIVAQMSDAYQRLEIGRPGFGCFISGPSKTADIEQSLVIGAHGAVSLTVFLL